MRYDPFALGVGGIQLLKLEYLEAETTRAPVPRNQEVPKDAFGTLTGRSILVATSHAWFHQCHPDPEGVKLNILREEFFPRLRERFPHTEILVFDDWHSCPQWPRSTQEEIDRFKNCMDHINSIYCYCDVVLFVQAPLPELEDSIFYCDLVPSEHEWLHFIDTIQYVGKKGEEKKVKQEEEEEEVKQEEEEEEKEDSIQRHNIVIGVKNMELLNIDLLRQTKEKTSIFFLRTPYGRPNRIPPEKRGWLYAERITVAIRMAAARPEMFDDVVTSNDPNLFKKIFLWSDELRNAAKLEKIKPGSISEVLQDYKRMLAKQKFTFADNDTLVDSLMTDLVKKFETNWREESRRQSDMSKRAREILMRWGSFSKDYVERAELLCDSSKVKASWVFPAFCVSLLAPMTSVVPFLFALEETGVDPSRDEHSLIISSIWLGCLCASVGVLGLHAFNFAFAKIPIGIHTVFALLMCGLSNTLSSIVLRQTIGNTIFPFETVVSGVLGFIAHDILFVHLKVVPVKDKRTGQVKFWALETWMHMPASHRFNLKARTDMMRVLRTTQLTTCFAWTYVIYHIFFFFFALCHTHTHLSYFNTGTLYLRDSSFTLDSLLNHFLFPCSSSFELFLSMVQTLLPLIPLDRIPCP